MRKNYTFFQLLKYKFDELMSKSVFAPIILLLITSILLVAFISGLMYYSNSLPPIDKYEIVGLDEVSDPGFFHAIYVTLLRMLDPGTVADDPLNWKFLSFMLLATFVGIFMFSMLVAIVNNGVIRNISTLRKGKSFVIENNHTIILGWSFQVFPIISELIIANENQKEATIVVLADKDKVFMEDEIKAKVGDFKTTKVVCRTGNPIDVHDLNIVNLNDSKSIIIIAPDVADPDSIVIKTILAITNHPNRKKDADKYHIVAEIRDPRNVAIAEIAGKDEVQLVIFDYLISRITAQTCRQAGLSVVFNELLDFSGDEIYFDSEPKLYGKTFVQCLFSYEDSTIIGYRKSNGLILIKPKFDEIYEEGDQLIAISEDDDTIVTSGKTQFNIDNTSIRQNVEELEPLPEATLVIGWNRRAHLIINELDNYVIPGSKLTVISDNPDSEKDLSIKCSELENMAVSFWYGDPTNRQILDDLNIESYDHIIVLSQTENMDIQAADARTLNTLLHLRDIGDLKGHHFSIVSEMLDDRNRELAEVTNTDDFIVSVKIDSLMLSQISENKELKQIFEDLFNAGGASIYIRPAEYYVELGKAINFYTVMEAAKKRGHLAIGMKLQKPDYDFGKSSKLAHGVIVNPPKSKELFYTKGDKIIVLSEEDLSASIH